MMEHILEIKTSQGGSFINLKQELYTLGRSSRNSIVIKDPQVSRYHATLIREENQYLNDYSYIIHDGDFKNKKSRNGLVINQKIYSVRILRTNDIIKLGNNVELKYYLASSETLKLLRLSYKNDLPSLIIPDEEVETLPCSMKSEENEIEVDDSPSSIRKTIVDLESSDFENRLKFLSQQYKI